MDASFRSKTSSSSSSFHSRPCQDVEAEVVLGFNGDTYRLCLHEERALDLRRRGTLRGTSTLGYGWHSYLGTYFRNRWRMTRSML